MSEAKRRTQQMDSETAEQIVEEWNRQHAVGAPVKAWPGVVGDENNELHTTTRTEAQLLGGHTPVVWVEDHPSCIALTHVQPYNE